MSNIDKQDLRSQSVEGSFYLAECGYCGQVMPSSKLRVLHSPDGEADCYCPHCNAGDCEIFDLGVVGSEVVNAWNYQQKRIEALLDELEPMALAHLNLNLLCDVYRSAYEEARHDGLVSWEAATSLAEENEELKCKLEAAEKRIAELEARDINIKRQAQALFEAIANPSDHYVPAYVRCLREALNGNGTAKGE